MKRLTLIGMGTGNPDHITMQGRKALLNAKAILIPQKGPGKSELAELREQICLDIIGSHAPIRYFEMPKRDPNPDDYVQEVHHWHDQICEKWNIAADGDEEVALLVWGDPSLYDSTLRIADRLKPKPEITVIPGITAISALCAAHAIPFNSLAGSVWVSTGRVLREKGLPKGCANAFIMLDGQHSFDTLDGALFDIWWGAYLGRPQEILAQGRLSDVCDQIIESRQMAQKTYGWIMDIYLLKPRHT